MKNNYKGIILAGGTGSRLADLPYFFRSPTVSSFVETGGLSARRCSPSNAARL